MNIFNSLVLRSLLLLLAVWLAGCTMQVPDQRQFNQQDGSRSDERAAPPPPAEEYQYLLQPGDTLRFEFVNQETLNRDVLIRPDGWITTPLIEDTRAAGRTISELRTVLLDKYAPVLRDPVLSIILTSSQPQFIYVGGEVRTGGAMLPFQPRLTAQQAIIAAGGISSTGELRSVFVVRDTGVESPNYMLSVLWNAKTGKFNDFYLQPRDIVFVPSSTIADMNQFVDQYINQLIPFAKSIGVTYNLGEYNP